MQRRCIWTGERTNDLVPVTVTTLNRFGTRPREETFFVQPQHEAAFRTFQARFVRYGSGFLKGIGLFVVMTLGVLLLDVAGVVGEEGVLVLMGTLTAALGIVVYRLPFATPETVALLGLRRALRLARASGVLVMLTGAAMLVTALVV